MKINNASVLNVIPKPGSGKYLGRTFYAAQVMDPVLGNLKVDFGITTPPGVGQLLSCEVEDQPTYGAYKLVRGSVMGGAAGNLAGTAAAPRAQGAFPVPADAKDQSIIRQNSLAHAVALVKEFPQHFLNGIADNWTADQMVKRVIEVAFTFSEFSSGRLDLEVQESLATKLTKP